MWNEMFCMTGAAHLSAKWGEMCVEMTGRIWGERGSSVADRKIPHTIPLTDSKDGW